MALTNQSQQLLHLVNEYVVQKELTLDDSPQCEFPHKALELIKDGADSSIQATVGTKGTLLHYFVLENDDHQQDRAIQHLLETNPTMAQITDANACTPLQVLMNQSNLNVKTAMMLRHHSMISEQATLGTKGTLLHHLIDTNHECIHDQDIRLLLKEHPTLIETQDGEQHTPLQRLMNQWIEERCSQEDFKHNALLLAQAGACLEVKDRYFHTTLLEHLHRSNHQGIHDEMIQMINGLNRKKEPKIAQEKSPIKNTRSIRFFQEEKDHTLPQIENTFKP